MDKIVRHGLMMRKTFDLTKIDANSWYAKHMYASMMKMQTKLKSIDCFVEVRDARIPLSSANPDFYSRLTAVRPLVVVFSKMDLADLTHKEVLEHYCDQQNEINRFMFANFKKNASSGVKNLIPTIINAVQDNNRYNNNYNREINVMVIGIPNVGKSSLINALRSHILKRRKGTRTGAVPGITRSVLQKIKVSIII